MTVGQKRRKEGEILQLKVSERQIRNDGNPSNFLISDGKLIIEIFLAL